MNPMLTSTPPHADTELLDIAVCAARAAGRIQLDCRNRTLAVDRFEAHDIKLEADRLSEEAILETIRRDMPDAHILTEEGGQIDGAGDYVWIIDPLDGTMNYYHGQHHFCTCVACYRRVPDAANDGIARLGEPVVGVVFAAAYNELFVGLPGKPSTCNGRPLRASSVTDLSDALVTTSLGSKPAVMERMGRVLTRLAGATRKIRIQGSCGLDICNVAAGRLSALYQPAVRCWDFAAARIIIEGAGGVLHAEESAPDRWDVLASAPGIFNPLDLLVRQG